jgi:hypothetical protein
MRGLLLLSSLFAALLIAVTASTSLLAEFPMFGWDRSALRMQVLWPRLPLLLMLIALALLSAARLIQVVPSRSLLRVHHHMWFAMTCAALVMLPSAILLARWADGGAITSAWLTIRLLEFAAQGITVALLLRAARHAWYADYVKRPR